MQAVKSSPHLNKLRNRVLRLHPDPTNKSLFRVEPSTTLCKEALYNVLGIEPPAVEPEKRWKASPNYPAQALEVFALIHCPLTQHLRSLHETQNQKPKK
jgi:hypothetical protein